MKIEEVDELVDPLGWERGLCHDGNCFPEFNENTLGHEGSYKKFNMTEHGEDGYISYRSLNEIIEAVEERRHIALEVLTETAKERIYREALDEINNLAIDVAMDFEETGIDSVDCGKLMDIANKAFFAEANQQPVSTDEKTVEKLQEQLNTAKKALTEISKTKDFYRSGRDHWEEFSQDALKAQKALAAIGNEGIGDE